MTLRQVAEDESTHVWLTMAMGSTILEPAHLAVACTAASPDCHNHQAVAARRSVAPGQSYSVVPWLVK